MNYFPVILSGIASLSLWATPASPALAQVSHDVTTEPHLPTEQQFQRIEQPLWIKLVVAGVGLGLIGLELWWFVLSQPGAKNGEVKTED